MPGTLLPSPQTLTGSASGPRTEGPQLPRAELRGQGLPLSSLSSAPGTWKEPSAGASPVPISLSLKRSHLNLLVTTSRAGQRCHGSRHLKPEGTVGVWALLRPHGLCSREALGAFPQPPPKAVNEDSAGVRTLRGGVCQDESKVGSRDWCDFK